MDFGRIQMVFWKGFGGITNDCKRFRLQNLLWWLGRRGADQEDLIICVALWTLYKRRRPLISDDFRAGCIASRNQTRSRLHLFASRVDFGATWGGFGRSKWRLKSIFGRPFAMPSPSALLNRFFGDFLKSEPWFFCAQPVFCKDFHQIDVFEKACKKTDLGSILGGQSDKKLRKHSVEKYYFFERRFFCVLW